MIVDKRGGGHDWRLLAEKSEERNWKDLVWMANLEGSDCEREPRKWSRINCFKWRRAKNGSGKGVF